MHLAHLTFAGFGIATGSRRKGMVSAALWLPPGLLARGVLGVNKADWRENKPERLVTDEGGGFWLSRLFQSR